MELGASFRAHATVQRDQPLAVEEVGETGEAVTVEFRGRAASTLSADDERWVARLPALAASAEPAVLRVPGNNMIEVSDVLIGEVWLASGQSNKE